jgi:hypothetical protein
MPNKVSAALKEMVTIVYKTATRNPSWWTKTASMRSSKATPHCGSAAPDRSFQEKGSQLVACLAFESLKDFELDQLARQVELLRKILELREALIAVKSPIAAILTFRQQVQARMDDVAARAVLSQGTGPERGESQIRFFLTIKYFYSPVKYVKKWFNERSNLGKSLGKFVKSWGQKFICYCY